MVIKSIDISYKDLAEVVTVRVVFWLWSLQLESLFKILCITTTYLIRLISLQNFEFSSFYQNSMCVCVCYISSWIILHKLKNQTKCHRSVPRSAFHVNTISNFSKKHFIFHSFMVTSSFRLSSLTAPLRSPTFGGFSKIFGRGDQFLEGV